MAKMPAGGMPQFKDVRIDAERDTLTLMTNMGGMPMPIKLEAKGIQEISFRPCKIKKLFKEVESEELVFSMDKMPKMAPPPGMPAMDGDGAPGGPGGGMPQPPADFKPELVIPKEACGKEFNAYKSILERFAKSNHIPFSK